MSEHVSGMLRALTDLNYMLDACRQDMQEKIDAVVTPEQRRKMDMIRAEYAVRMEEIEEQVKKYEEEVKEIVLREGETAQGGGLQAVFVKGRVSWDKGLDEISEGLDWLARYRRVGNPSVSIRVLK